MMRRINKALALALVALLLPSCSTAPKNRGEQLELESDASITIKQFKNKDPGMEKFFGGAVGYAVFPSVGKGGIGVAGAYGKGVLYEGGKVAGFCDLSQGSIGFQLGGQAYKEVIFFQFRENLRQFKSGQFAFAAQASAVAVTAGASADAAYENGVAVFTMTSGGLMFEASIGGQQFDYVDKRLKD